MDIVWSLENEQAHADRKIQGSFTITYTMSMIETKLRDGRSMQWMNRIQETTIITQIDSVIFSTCVLYIFQRPYSSRELSCGTLCKTLQHETKVKEPVFPESKNKNKV